MREGGSEGGREEGEREADGEVGLEWKGAGADRRRQMHGWAERYRRACPNIHKATCWIRH